MLYTKLALVTCGFLVGDFNFARCCCVRYGAVERQLRGFCDKKRLAGVLRFGMAYIIPAFVANCFRSALC